MTQVLLIDLSSIAHPIYHTESDPAVVSTKTVERVRALANGRTRGVGVCVEGGRSFRKDLDPSYKANRPESDAVLYHQIDVAIDILRADGFPILRAEGFEADDVIATATALLLASQREGPDVEAVTVVSADKDLLQLVGPRVTVKSLKDGSLIDAATVEAKFGVRPDQMLDFLALVGDTSDNIKGCKDVGKVRAAGLLRKYGSITGLFRAIDGGEALTPALTDSLHEFRARVESVQSLLRLRTDAPIELGEILKERVAADVAEFGASDMVITDDAVHVTTDTGAAPRFPFEAVEVAPDAEHYQSSATLPAIKINPPIVSEPAPVEWERQLEPRNMAQMKALALDLFASKLVFSSTGYGHAAGILSTILAGRELGLPAMASMRAFHLIDNKPTMAADLIRALVLRSGVCEYFRCIERTNERATFAAKRKGDPEITLTFTIEDGRRAWQKSEDAWLKSGWTKNPADMLVARSGSKLARLVAPDVVGGLYAREELE